MTAPMSPSIVACHTTAAASIRFVNPNVFMIARSRRRRRTDAMSVSAKAMTAPAANPVASSSGVAPIER